LNPKEKVFFIVLIQVILIVTSFLVLVYIESEWLIVGNSINHAGFNRYLSASIMLDLHSSENHYFKDNQSNSIQSLRENILLLKNGGEVDGSKLRPIPDELLPYWNIVYDDFEIFEKNISLYDLPEGKTIERHSEIDLNYNSLLNSSDELTSKFSNFLERVDILLIQLQIILLLVNSTVHVLLVFIIFRILNKASEEKIKLEKFATIGQMGASISHDLRNPLAVIKGSMDILKLKKEKPLSKLEEKQFTKISNSVDDITYLTNDILNFTKTTNLNLQEIGLLKLIQDSMDEISVPDRIEIKIPKNNIKIKVDEIKMKSVISNLIKNAIDSIDGKGAISIEATDGLDDVLLIVTDSGSGIPSEKISHIFEPLFTTKIHGTGLGLANCKRIIEQHGGTIDVLNNPTRFFIHLPK
jgi:signal transduction histidine kinase